MPLVRFLRSSATAWTVAGVAVLTCWSVARNGRTLPTAVEIVHLGRGMADRHAAVRQSAHFHKPYIGAHLPMFLSNTEMQSSLNGTGVLFNVSQSVTLTPGHPSASLPGSTATAASLMIEASTLSELDDAGFIDIPAAVHSYDISQLDVLFTPTKANTGYYVEIDFEQGGPLSDVTISPPGGPAKKLPVNSKSKSVHLVVVPADTNPVQLMCTPHGGDMGVKAVKITGF